MQILSKRIEEYSKIFEIRVDNLIEYTNIVEAENIRLKKRTITNKLSRKEEEMAIISEISKAMVQGRPKDEMLQMVIEGIIRAEGADNALILTHDHDKKVLKGRLGFGKNAAKFCSKFSLFSSQTDSLISQAVTSKRQQAINSSTAPAADKKILAALNLESADIIPLTMNDMVSGVLIIGWKLSSFKGKEKDQETLMLFANQASLILGPSKESSRKKETKRRKRSLTPLDID